MTSLKIIGWASLPDVHTGHSYIKLGATNPNSQIYTQPLYGEKPKPEMTREVVDQLIEAKNCFHSAFKWLWYMDASSYGTEYEKLFDWTYARQGDDLDHELELTEVWTALDVDNPTATISITEE